MAKPIAILAGALAAAAPMAGAAQDACDRACLSGVITLYLDAMVAHDPSALPLADGARFTEDGAEMALGEGLWAGASGLTGYRLDILDVRQGVAGAHVVAEEDGRPVLLALRLKVEDREIAEIETMVVRGAGEMALFNTDSLTEVTPEMAYRPTPEERNTREEMIAIADTYPAGLKAGSFETSNVPFAPEAYRFENGMMMAGPGCTLREGCDDIKGQSFPTLSGLTGRLAAVDEEAGIVWYRLDFGPSPVREPGRVLVVWEAFKVWGDQMHAVEAFLEEAPEGSPSGWD